MSKFLAALTLLILSVAPVAQAWDFDYNPGRPGQPSRPGQGPGRPGDGPGRPGQGPDRPGQPGRPGQGPGWPAPRPPAQSLQYQTVGTFRVQKILETTNTVRVNHPNVKVIRLIARNNDVEVIEARAQLDNGREIYMDGITGGLGRDRGYSYTLSGPYGERIRSITVRAVTRSLTGSRADLEVSVGVYQ